MDELKNGYIKQAQPLSTKRYCQCLKLQPLGDKIKEYKYWHQPQNIWKEIPEGIRKAGILDMEIYILGDTEFMVVETPLDFDWDLAFGKLATYQRQAEWEDFMSQFQIAEKGSQASKKWQLMERIFSLKECLSE